ncbi:MAG: aminodeoxychorismate/anthranilate synthase component II [Pseudomonadota bacterium]
MILMIDNYDSFTYNLVQMLQVIGEDIEVRRNDQIDLDGIEALKPSAIVISPGPGTPVQAGITLESIRLFSPEIPVLGVCLGHQAIAEAFGGKVVRAKRIMHGKISLIYHDGRTICKGLPNPFRATRYHSLIVERDALPDCLEISAWTEEGEIMGLRHRKYRVEGVQFHPESILTEVGSCIVANFVQLHTPQNLDHLQSSLEIHRMQRGEVSGSERVTNSGGILK